MLSGTVLYLIAYDVSDDEVRERVRRLLRDWGGERIQYSAFLLEASEVEVLQLMREVRRLLGPLRGKVVAIPICERDLRRVVTVAHDYELPDEEGGAIV